MIDSALNRGVLWMVAVVVTAWAPSARAARLPDWAQPIANQPSVMQDEASGGFVVLLSERIMTFDSAGLALVEDRIAKQAQRGATDEVALGSLLLGSNWEVDRARAWHQRPGKRVKKSRKNSMIELSDTSTFLSDNLTRHVVISDVVEGSLVFFEFRAEWSPYALSFLHVFTESEPSRRSKLEVRTPPGWEVDWQWVGELGPDPTTKPGSTVWEVEDVEYAEPEPLSGDALDGSLTLAVALRPATGQQPAGPAVFDGWGDVSAWMQDLIGERSSIPVEISERWTGSPEVVGDDLDRIVATVRSVRDSVRYVAKEVGIGGYQPRPAVETNATLWGDCKDKSTLLTGALAQIGVTAFPVLVNALLDNTVAEAVPTLGSFNHMITAIQLGDIAVPDSLASAMLDDPVWGRLLIVDTTDELTAPGQMSAALQGRRALVISDGQGSIITLPGTNPQDHRVDHELAVRIEGDGRVRFTRVSRYLGQPATSYRAAYRAAAQTWKDAVEEAIRGQWIGAYVTSFEVEEEAPDGSLLETVSWSVHRLQEDSGSRFFSLFGQFSNDLPRVSLRRREQPVVYRFPRILSSQVTVTGLPEGFLAPAATSQHGDGWGVETDFEVSPDRLVSSAVVSLERTRFEGEEGLKDLRGLYRAVAGLRGATVEIPAR